MSLAHGLEPAYTISGGPPQIAWYRMRFSQTLKAGHLTHLAATMMSGMRRATAANTAACGVMVHDVTTTATETMTDAPVYLCNTDTVFRIKGHQTTLTAPRSLLNTRKVNWRIGSLTTGPYVRLSTAVTKKNLVVVGVLPAQQNGTAPGKTWYVRFTPSGSQVGAAAAT